MLCQVAVGGLPPEGTRRFQLNNIFKVCLILSPGARAERGAAGRIFNFILKYMILTISYYHLGGPGGATKI